MNLYLKQTPRMHPEDFFSSSISTLGGSELSQIYMQTGMRGKYSTWSQIRVQVVILFTN